MEIEEININELTPDQNNPRLITKEEQEHLRTSINHYGLVDPIIIDLSDDNTIIGGHQRYEILREEHPDINLKLIRHNDIGWVFNETEFTLKDKNERTALNLALNKISGDWDFGKLDNNLVELQESHFNMELTGFDEAELFTLETTNEFMDNLKDDNINNINKELDDIDDQLNNKSKKEHKCPNCGYILD